MPVFTGLSLRQFRLLVRIVAGRGGEQTGTGRRWSLPLADRVLLIAVYYRTNLTPRQVALLFGVSKSAAHRVVDHLAPLLALAPVARRHSPDTVLIVRADGEPFADADWADPEARSIAFVLMHEGADAFLLLLNAARNGVEFVLPDPPGAHWELELSSDPDLALNDGDSVIVGESAFALLRSAVTS